MECIVCKSDRLEMLENPKYDKQVIGDKRIYEGQCIKKVICKECGCIQPLKDDNYKKEIDRVYENYAAFNVKAFNKKGEQCIPRLQIICQKINEVLNLPQKGSVLDIGCGEGEWLACFRQVQPEWDLYGMDICEHFGDAVIKKTAKAFFVGIDEVKKSQIKFDLIVINYALCLCNNIMDILDSLHKILKDDGTVFIIDTDFTVHPYLLNVVESVIWFNRETMDSLLERVGLEVINTGFTHEKKEIWAFARKGIVKKECSNVYQNNKKKYYECLEYLNRAIDLIEETVDRNLNIGIFGTSNAGIWVSEIIHEYQMLESRKGGNIFFIDEDEDVFEKNAGPYDFPIYHIEDISSEAVIFLPFPDYIAANIKERLEKKYPNFQFMIFQ